MLDLLELEPVRLTANTRTEHLHGREYVVSEAVILREGVLNGSEGPLFYPLYEIVKNVGMWNGVTLVAPHPYVFENGHQKHVSVHDAGMEEKFGVGMCYNDRVEPDADGKKVRKVDLYFDVERANAVDGRIIPAVRSGEPVNVSTGIATTKRRAVDNSTYNGHSYTHTVHNIGADHLAVLLDEKGACSVFDGCGINIDVANVAGWTLTDINEVVLYNSRWSKGRRDALAKTAPDDFAGPHHSYPIETQEDVKSAATLAGRAADPAAVKAKIIAIAGRKGLTLPAAWTGTKNDAVADIPSNKVGAVSNAWTDAARQSSILARERTHKTLQWHGKRGHGKKDSWVKPEHLTKLAAYANRAVGSHIQGDSRTAMSSHEKSATGHANLARRATQAGEHEAASLHSDAHAAHLHAASMHKKSVNNSAVTYPEVCPKCKGKMDPGVGKCVKCGYEADGHFAVGNAKPISNSGGQTMNEKAELVSWLTTNCDCWKDDGSETVLNTLSEERLRTLKDVANKAKVTDIAVGIVKKVGGQVGFKGNYNNLPGFVANSVANAKKKPPMADDDGDEPDNNARADGLSDGDEVFGDSGTTVSDTSPGLEDFAPIGTKGTRPGGGTQQTQGKLTKGGGSMLPESGQLGVMNKESVLNALKGLTDEEFIGFAPPGLRQTLAEGRKAVKDKKVAIINTLTGHIPDEKDKKIEILNLWKKTIPQLEEILKYSRLSGRSTPPTGGDTEQQVLANFFGQTGAPTGGGTGGGGNGRRPVFNTTDVLEPFLDPFEGE